MIFKRIHAMLQSIITESPLFPPTLLYNEGWLLRIVLDWFSKHNVPNHPLNFYENSRWFSEALLPSAFLARCKGDSLAESWTHADGVIGHFLIGREGKMALSLLPNATHFVVLEAKMFSGLASGVKNARYFDQAARTIACIAEVLSCANRSPLTVSHLGFYVLAPDSQIRKGIFANTIDCNSIKRKVEKRVQQYAGARDQWYSEWFQSAFQHIAIRPVSWEEIIADIQQHESASANAIEGFYKRCIEFNQRHSSVRPPNK